MEDDAPVEIKKGSSKGLDIVRHECEFIKYCETNAKTLSEHDWYAMISNLAPFDMGVELIHRLSEPYPNYKYNNTQSLLLVKQYVKKVISVADMELVLVKHLQALHIDL